MKYNSFWLSQSHVRQKINKKSLDFQSVSATLVLLFQYHIWLSADSHGVLVLVPNYPVLNILLTSFIFVCASHEIHAVTAQLMPYFVPLGMENFSLNL